MKKLQWTPLLALLLMLSGCEMIGDLMKMSFWAGAIMVIAVIALIIFLLRRLF